MENETETNQLFRIDRDSPDGRIRSNFNVLEFRKQYELNRMPPDVYLAFGIKALIDDFAVFLKILYGDGLNQEQYEAKMMENIQFFLSQNTRVNVDHE